MRTTRPVIALAGALALASTLALTACQSGETVPQTGTPTVKIGLTTAWSTEYSPYAVSDKMGYFTDEGLNVEWVNLDGGTTVATQLQQGKIDIGIMAPEPVIIGHQPGGGFTIQYFGTYYRHGIFGVGVTEDSPIRAPADLKGTRIGVPNLASSSVQMAQAVARSAGLTDKDLTFIAVGTGQTAIQALKDGKVDALSVWDSMYQRFTNAGIPMRMLDNSAIANLPSGPMAAQSARLKSEPELFAKAGRALLKGVAFSAENPEAAVRINWEHQPSLRDSSKSEEQDLQDQTSVLSIRLQALDLGDGPGTWGSFPAGSMEDYIAFMAATGQLTGEVDPAAIYTEELVPQLGEFDADAIATQAREWQPS